MLIKNYRKAQTQRQQEAKIFNFTTSYCGWIVKYLCSVNFYSTSQQLLISHQVSLLSFLLPYDLQAATCARHLIHMHSHSFP